MQIESHRDCKYDYLDVHDGDSEDAPLLGHLCGYRVPESIISSYNFLWMKFETDGSIQNRGFYSVYEGMAMGCGGLLTEEAEQISSPRHPDRYPHSLTCRWLIRAPETHVIRLTFTSFYLEMDSQCRFDYVDVEESSGVSLGRFCGSRIPPILTSLENTIIVKFVTDTSISRDGFNANYEFLDASQACGGTYYQESGVIRSPGFPNRYPHSAHCVWIIQAKDYRQVTLNVTRFEMEDHENCRFDYLELRNGGTETSPLLGKYCGNRTIPEIRSHSNILRLEFKSDISMSAPGFEIFFDTTAVGCGGILSSPSGSIVSPNYPQAYPFNADCEWLIRVSHGSAISVTIIEIDIEEHETCMYDYLQIFDGDSENSKCLLNICNNQQNPGPIVSKGNTMLLRFRSDSNQEAGGFHLVYHTLCNNVLTNRRGVIESPNFPDTYPHNHNCSWTISAPRGNNISIAFSHFFLETTASCDADYVEVLEVQGNKQIQLGKYCGGQSSPPKTIETSTDTAIVRLITDSSVTREGFRLEYAMKGCGGDIENKDFGFITSPNYPNGYPISTSCFWHISYPPGSRVELTILELDIEAEAECFYDYLAVYGGEDENSPRLMYTCHRINGSQIVTSHGNQMVVHFSSDSFINGRGFKASFRKLDAGTSGCGGRFTAAESTILSPNFPDPYNVNDECEWLIETSFGHRVELEFYDFEIPQGTNCSLGHVAIYDGRNSSSPLLGKYCGAKPEGIISSSSNQMLVKLVADGNNVGKGFRAHYSMGCGSRLLADEGGEILSPNYPHGFPELINCRWIIYTSQPGEKVSLLVTHLEISASDNCSFASLTIKDGDMPDSPVSGMYCGYRSPPLIMSRGSILQVLLQNHGIFRATYGPASTHCGGAFKSPEGTFATPGYPLNYALDMECIWTIEASAGSKVLLSFTGFALENSEYCNKDYVEIHKNDASGPMIGRYCGSEIPSNLTAAHKLWIKFRSDDIGTSNGFSAQYSTQHSNVLNGTEGEIASPGYPHKYSRSNVEWTVIVPTGMFVSVRFIEFGILDLGESHSCVSTLRIYDGFDDSAPVLGEFCGYNIPEPLVSTSNVLFIRLEPQHHYDTSFYLQWAAVTESGVVLTAPSIESGGTACWQELNLNTSELLVQSPNYPEYYPDNYNCTYVIRAPHYQHVELNITDLDLEEWFPQCSYDRLEIYYALNPTLDAWHLNATYCGRETPPLFVSPTNLMKLQFITDGYTHYRGFNATAMPRCGARFTESNGVIKSEYIHTHLSGRLYQTFFCEYYIHVKPKRTIQLTFDQFSVASDSICSTNYLVIRNGGSSTSPLLGSGTYCGTSAPSLPETSTNEAYVKVVISSLAQGVPVFELRYTELSLGCGGHIYLSQETRNAEISSPNYPAPPTHDIECEWIITSPAGTRIRMDFENEFHMSPDCFDGDNVEYLQIYDGGTDMAPALQRYCGHDQPSSVQSTGNALYAVYVTAVDEPQAGFKAIVRIAACGGTISSTYSSAIKSPNYPQPYGNSQECEWFLKMKNGYHIILTIMDLDTPANQNCSLTDYLEIRDYDAQGELLGIFCGSLTNGSQVIDVPSPQAYIKFKTNSAVTGKGFHIVMNAKFNEGCGGYVGGLSSGVITSPHYPNPLTGRRQCSWHIDAPEGRRVKLTFNEFNLPRDQATGICLSHLSTTNISYWWRGEVNLTKLCGNSLPAEILSYTSTAVVVFATHGLAAGQGFSLSYSTDEEANCGGPLLLPSGNISSPPFTAMNDTYIDCRWKLQGDGLENRTVVIKLDVLDVPGLKSSYCRKGGVYVYGQNFFFGRYCENYTSPVTITSPLAATTVRLTGLLDKAFRGIRGTYNVSNCGGIIDVTSDVNITSPGYPNSYPPNTDCHWILKVPRGEEISLTTVDLRLENDCSKDYVKITNGYRHDSPVLGKFCGDHSPHPITSTNNFLVIKFHSDEFGTAPGFWMTSSEIQRGCGGIIGMAQGNISSPNYPSRYGHNEECVWIIEYLPGYTTRLEFVGRFDIETSSSCDKDYL
ncbi:Cubilin, partial [Stegodyphus mimosarum]